MHAAQHEPPGRHPARLTALVSLFVAPLALAGCPPASSSPPLPPGPLTNAPTATPASSPAPAAEGTGAIDLLVLEKDGRPIANAVAWLLGVKPRTPVPTAPLVLEQEGLAFKPPFLVGRKGQTLEVTNADPELHNVHSSAPGCCFDMSVTSGKKATRVLEGTCEATFLCDIHAHMRATVLVLDADFVRTDAAGRARLESVPSGSRKLRVQALDRERAELEVTLAPGGTASVTATLLAPKAPPQVLPPEKLPWPVLADRLVASLEEARRWAAAGDGAAARREVSEEALGRWYAGALQVAIRDLDAASGDRARRGRAEELKSRLRGLARLAEEAAGRDAAARPARLEKLAREAREVGAAVAAASRELPRRVVAPSPPEEKKP